MNRYGINHDYLIDTAWCESGGSCDFMPILGTTKLGFKSFKYKNRAINAHKIQKKLSHLDLSPKVITPVCKIAYYFDPELLRYWNPTESATDWGFITERADLLEENNPGGDIPYKKLQNLVNNIKIKTKLKFWDCHLTNIGYIKRRGKKKLVCIDTGKESFMRYTNAWGFEEPGPMCPLCNKFQCCCTYDDDYQ